MLGASKGTMCGMKRWYREHFEKIGKDKKI